MLWLKDITKWNSLPLEEKVEALRKHYCTGPCGQSSSVCSTREVTNKVLKEVLQELKK